MNRYLALVLLTLPSLGFATSMETEIQEALVRVKKLDMMRSDKTYTLPARGETVTGESDDFLRRREPSEILASGLSCGCGDFAAAFYGLMRERGAKLIYVDAVRISAASWAVRDHGHTGVAVFDPEIERWVLVDPTNDRLLSYDWDRSEKMYKAPGGPYWIWYTGPLEDYPVRNHPQLKENYEKGLRSIPAAVWEKEIVRLDFEAGDSMKKSDGNYRNPRLSAFLERYAKAYDALPAQPARRARVTISDGGEGAKGECHPAGAKSWDCPVGRGSAMSPSFFSYVEEHISKQYVP